jgi:probable addiction module antidote protein
VTWTRTFPQCSQRLKTSVWDPAEHLETEEDIAAYLEGAFAEGDPSHIAAALGDVARTKVMARIARDAGFGRESLYKAHSANGNPEFVTIMKVVNALELKLRATPVDA